MHERQLYYSAALEQQYAALAYSQESADWERSSKGRSRFGRAERWALRHAESYFWASDILHAILTSASSLPIDTQIRVPQFAENGAVWWWFERPLDLGVFRAIAAVLIFTAAKPGSADGTRTVVISTYGLADDRVHLEVKDSVVLDEFLTIAEVDRGSHEEITDWAGPRPTAPTSDAATSMLIRLVIACLLWIEQRILVTNTLRAERHVRKRLESIDAAMDVRVVMLRRKDYSGASDEGSTRAPEWTCQWIVGGHWRQQFYPATNEHKPIWIMPYVKGPENKPLKIPGQQVYVVKR